jgi:hypothetical protein
MKLLVEVKESKAEFVIELLDSLSFVKAKKLVKDKPRLVIEMEEAVAELNLIKAGKKKARKFEDFLDEL